MIPISSAISDGLHWSKTSCKRGFELKHNGEIVGALRKMSFWSTEFHAESAHGSWRFRRTGCFRTGTEIVDSTTNALIAIFKANWSGGGTLAFSDRQIFRITSKGFWRPVWTVQAESGQPVLNIHARKKTVEFPGDSKLYEDRLILLSIFAWHVMRQAAEDGAAVVAVTG